MPLGIEVRHVIVNQLIMRSNLGNLLRKCFHVRAMAPLGKGKLGRTDIVNLVGMSPILWLKLLGTAAIELLYPDMLEDNFTALYCLVCL
mmetsp:Transcript_9149/g.23928  ORF Transcript_9149/g.23928 Transcript_9149/m.23928 type:complete len:89 (-) Transcript_9149:229-495(-)